MAVRNVKIFGTGKYLPQHVVTAHEMDSRLGVPEGWTEHKAGIRYRHFAIDEDAVQMAVKAISAALKDANLSLSDIDCIVSASGTTVQALPCSAALVHEALQASSLKIPAFDINATCLSFVTGLDVMSSMIEAGCYDRVLLFSSEVASVGLDWSQPNSAGLFGDGAVAVIIGRTPPSESSRIIHSHMETYSIGAHYAEIRAGGTKAAPSTGHPALEKDYLFDMDGESIYRLSSRVLPTFLKEFLGDDFALSEMDFIVPHQASGMAMQILRKKLGIAKEKMINIISTHGNMIAASIPAALHEGIHDGRIQRGHTIMLLGTAAGLSIGGVILEY